MICLMCKRIKWNLNKIIQQLFARSILIVLGQDDGKLLARKCWSIKVSHCFIVEKVWMFNFGIRGNSLEIRHYWVLLITIKNTKQTNLNIFVVENKNSLFYFSTEVYNCDIFNSNCQWKFNTSLLLYVLILTEVYKLSRILYFWRFQVRLSFVHVYL
jgi:hypothetical protein